MYGYLRVNLRRLYALVSEHGADGFDRVFNTPAKYRWKELRGNVHGQYSTRIVGKVLFHAVPYSKQDNSTLLYRSYNKPVSYTHLDVYKRQI